MAVVPDQGLKDGTPLRCDLAAFPAELFDNCFYRLKCQDTAPYL